MKINLLSSYVMSFFANRGQLYFFDVLYFLQEYSAGNPDGDFNEDGLFDFFDVLAFLQAFSAGCP